MDESEKGIILFRHKETGDVFGSRHTRPYFLFDCCGDEIMKTYDVSVVYGKAAEKYLVRNDE